MVMLVKWVMRSLLWDLEHQMHRGEVRANRGFRACGACSPSRSFRLGTGEDEQNVESHWEMKIVQQIAEIAADLILGILFHRA